MYRYLTLATALAALTLFMLAYRKIERDHRTLLEERCADLVPASEREYCEGRFHVCAKYPPGGDDRVICENQVDLATSAGY